MASTRGAGPVKGGVAVETGRQGKEVLRGSVGWEVIFMQVIPGLTLGEKFGSDTGFHRRTVGGQCLQMPVGGAMRVAAGSVRQEVGEHGELKRNRPPK